MSDWCILRCSGSSTLQLASSLNEAGIEAWTPIEIRIREKVDRRKGSAVTKIETPAALIPSFVFADFERRDELAQISHTSGMVYRVWDSAQRRMVAKDFPKFWIFKDFGKYSRVPEMALAPLRVAEKRRKPRGEVRTFRTGDRVKLVEGGFAGLSGVVQSVKGKHAVVSFPGSTQSFTFPMWVLLDDERVVHVCQQQSEQSSCFRSAA